LGVGAFDVVDAVADGFGVVAEAFVVVFGPNGLVWAEVVAGGVFGAFGDGAEVVVGGGDEEVGVPELEGEGEDLEIEACGEGGGDGFGGGVELFGGEEEFGVFHAGAVGGFEGWVWGVDDSVFDPVALVAAEPSAVGGHGEHDCEGGHFWDFIRGLVCGEGVSFSPR
jgi:hypothetical protein